MQSFTGKKLPLTDYAIMNIYPACRLILFVFTILFISALPRGLDAGSFSIDREGTLYNYRIIISPDGSRVMLSCNANNNRHDYLQIDNTYTDFQRVISDFVFSDNGRAAAYTYGSGRDSCAVLVRGNKKTEFGPNTRDIRINRDGSNYIYLKYNSSHEVYVCVKDKVYGPFSSVEGHGFNNHGDLYGFLGYKDGVYKVFVGDKVYGPCDFAEPPVFSKSGSRFTFNYEKAGKYYYNIDGNTYGPFNEQKRVLFSPDSSKVFIITRDDDEKFSFSTESITYGPFSYAGEIGPVVINNDGTKFAFLYYDKSITDTCYNFGCLPFVYAAEQAEYCCSLSFLNLLGPGPRSSSEIDSMYVQYNEFTSGGFGQVEDLYLGSDSITYRYIKDDSHYVCFNRQVYGPYIFVKNLVISDSGSHIVYDCTARGGDGKSRGFIKHNELEYPMPLADRIGITADGSRFCAVYGNEKSKYIMINGKSEGPYDAAEFLIKDNRIFAAYVNNKIITLAEK